MEREQFRSKFRARWLDGNSGSGWKEKEWRKNAMSDAEKMFAVRVIEEQESPSTKSKSKGSKQN